MAGDTAFTVLTGLQGQFADAERQWQYLYDIVAAGYKDAYNLHIGALKAAQENRLHREQDEARMMGIYMFVFSVVSAGFAGGAVGGLMGKWVSEPAKGTADAVFREGMKGAASRTVTQVTKMVIPQSPPSPSTNPNPFVPAAGKPFEMYIDNKTELDGCFARVSSFIRQVVALSQQEKWSASTAQDFADSLTKNCPLLSQVPDPFHPLDQTKVAKASELAMWVAWANALDWTWWKTQYQMIDSGRFDSDLDAEEDADFDSPVPRPVVDNMRDLDPILRRFADLGKPGLVELRLNLSWQGGPIKLIDLRKVKALRLPAMPDLPFERMQDLDMMLVAVGDAQRRVKYLNTLSDLPPSHMSYKTP